jgi:hypothetical protein
MPRAGKCLLAAASAILAIPMTTNGALAQTTIDSAARPYFIGGGAIATIFFIYAGAMLIRKGNRYRRIAATAAQWPIVTGKVVSSKVAKHADSDSGDYFVPKVHYVYQVDGASRNGRVIRAGLEDRGYPLEQQARDDVARYPVGSHVPVRYDPQNPADAVLELGQIGAGNNLLAGVLLVLVGVGGAAFTVFSAVTPGS